MSKIYETGRIYCIRSYQTDDIYIGSTFNPLHKRLYDHKLGYKSWKNGKKNYITSFELMQYDDCHIELIEEHHNLNRKQLEKIEGEHIRNCVCVNKIIVGRTRKEHYCDNKDKLQEKMKEYYNDNKDKLQEKMKEYYDDNKDKLQENTKKYYNDNKKMILEKYKQKYTCDVCGGKFTYVHKLQHLKSNKHMKALK